jgi:hypothetical protein
MSTGQEQAQTIAEIVDWRDKNNGLTITDENHLWIIDTLTKHRQSLLKIADAQAQQIEALQKQLNASPGSMKQYTESELRVMFENPRIEAMRKHTPNPAMPRHADGSYLFEDSNRAWYWFLEAARSLGAIKKPEKGEKET